MNDTTNAPPSRHSCSMASRTTPEPAPSPWRGMTSLPAPAATRPEGLHARHQLGQISGLDRRRISEIEAALVFAGLIVTTGTPQPGVPGKPGLGKAA
jgi:hypothetical protein